MSRFGDIDRLLSLCAMVPKQGGISMYEQRLNNVISLRRALELVEPLHTALRCAESNLLADTHDMLTDVVYTDVLNNVGRVIFFLTRQNTSFLLSVQVSLVINESAKVQKASSGTKTQRCFAVKVSVKLYEI